MKKPVDIRVAPIMGEVSANERPASPIDTSPRFQHFITFTDTEILPLANANVSAYTIVAFKPRRLVIPPSIADQILIYEMKVGKNSFFFGTNGVSGECFPPLPKDSADTETMLRLENLLVMEMDVAQNGMLVTLGVQNISQKKVRFTAMMWGMTQ